MLRAWAGFSVAVSFFALCFACGGGRASTNSAPPPLTVGVQGKTDQPAPTKLRFGKPSTWQQAKETRQEDGHDVVHYTLSGEAASVQLILHPPGEAPPNAELERALFRETLQAEIPEGLAFDEVVPHARTLMGREVTGAVQGMTLRAPDAVIHGEHRSYVVQGARTSCLVVVDIPDIEHSTAQSEVEEVLGNLQVP